MNLSVTINGELNHKESEVAEAIAVMISQRYDVEVTVYASVIAWSGRKQDVQATGTETT